MSLPTLVQAETKSIVSEASYKMGDGATLSFAEAMVLQKAKQTALEQAEKSWVADNLLDRLSPLQARFAGPLGC